MRSSSATGYAVYVCAYAASAALVARQEDVQNVTTPITLVILGSFFLSFPALDDPGGTLARVLSSFVPPPAPLVMPARTVLGDAPVLEIAGSVVVTAAAAAGSCARGARLRRRSPADDAAQPARRAGREGLVAAVARGV